MIEVIRQREQERAKRLAIDNDKKHEALIAMRIYPHEHLHDEHPCRVCGCHLRYAAKPDHCLWCEAVN